MNPVIQDLRDILGGNENLIKLFKKCNFLSNSVMENLVSNVALLNNEYGVDINVLRKGLAQRPAAFMRTSGFFRNVLIRVEEELGIPRNSGMFLYGIYLLASSSKKSIESKCQTLRSFGWTEYDVSELMRRNPNCILTSIQTMRRKLGFLMTELGYKPDYLATHSALFTYSLEKRIVPRRRVLLVLKKKGLLDYNFYSAITKTETQFLKTLIEPFEEDVPGLLQLYQKSKGCSKVEASTR
ncbi:uncharacterized protein LOC141647571 [Silene latifolia]|uniref:uncharacterized protein LOC141647571 n=1 Tax=Silene latifolia TaxID=37657 RepID=UPI003D781C21